MNAIESMGNKFQKDISSLACTFKQSTNPEVQEIAKSLESIGNEIKDKIKELGELSSDLTLYKKLDLDPNAEIDIISICNLSYDKLLDKDYDSKSYIELYNTLKDIFRMILTCSYKNNKIPCIRITNLNGLNEMIFKVLQDLNKEGFSSKLQLYEINKNQLEITEFGIDEILNINIDFIDSYTRDELELQDAILINADCIVVCDDISRTFDNKIIKINKIPTIANLLKTTHRE